MVIESHFRNAGRLAISIFILALPELPGAPLPGNTPQANQELARQILRDQRMDQVIRMGRELLKTGLNAGSGYAEVWIRDLNTFIVPALEVVPRETLRESLLIFFHFQGDDGNIVDGYVPADRAKIDYQYRTSPTQPKLRAHKNTVETDQESSLIQALGRYIRQTGDRTILDEIVRGKTVRERMELALRYPLEHRFSKSHGLVWGATTADWGDVQPEHPWGVELDESSHRAIDIYDNAFLVVAIHEYLEILGNRLSEQSSKWNKHAVQLSQAIRQHLWEERKQKFIPHLYLESSPFPKDFDENQVFYHGGTAVAIEADLLQPNEILASYHQMLANLRLSGAATIGLTLYPAYPLGAFKNPSMVPYSYQNGGDWTWFGARMARQLASHGFVKEAYRELTPMLERVIRHQGFYEWWTVANEPRGSGKFRGSAGVLLEAIEELRRWAKSQVQE